MDPFVLIGKGTMRLPTGFPDHQHRGQQTVTYTLEGSNYHEDFRGHSG